MARTLSLVVPSGNLTLGNLLGAIVHWVADQRGTDSIYGVADLHALTTPHDPAAVRAATMEQAALLLAAGLDPSRCTIFVQSHVPAHAELLWLLEATAYDGELRRMIQYKEKSARHESVRAALLTYPVLMAADVLLYDVATVPVGDDQRQHLELARDLALRFNKSYGPTFTVPRAVTPLVGARLMDLQDPAVKMSKSVPLEAGGVIRLLDPPGVVRRKIARAVTDSGQRLEPGAEPGPGVANLLTMLAACTGQTGPAQTPQQAAAGLVTYRDLKEACAEAVVALLTPLQDRYATFAADPVTMTRVLRDGAGQARALAEGTLARAKAAIGLLPG
ncbi:MAG: tryptophan--tRNA ligase [Streptosporangiaceae bacterium]